MEVSELVITSPTGGTGCSSVCEATRLYFLWKGSFRRVFLRQHLQWQQLDSDLDAHKDRQYPGIGILSGFDHHYRVIQVNFLSNLLLTDSKNGR